MAYIEEFGSNEKLSAEQFLCELRRSNDRWWDNGQSQWVYRGVGNSEKWKLLPSAWRPLECNKLAPLFEAINALNLRDATMASIPSYAEWMSTEIEAIYQFCDLAASQGFRVDRAPGSPLNNRRLVYYRRNTFQAHAAETFNLAPVAQHHGVPTRLLDWSRDPYLAAYFALSEDFRDKEAKKVCVWALNIHACQSLRFFGSAARISPFKVLEQPAYQNSYLSAQKGLFIQITNAHNYFDDNGVWPAMEDYCDEEILNPPDSPFLLKFILDSSEFKRALEILDREGINKAALMPTLDNVADTVIGRWSLI